MQYGTRKMGYIGSISVLLAERPIVRLWWFAVTDTLVLGEGEVKGRRRGREGGEIPVIIKSIR